MVFTKFVQIGRTATFNYGPHEGKLVTILDVVGEKRVLVEGLDTLRQVVPIRRLTLQKFVVEGVVRGQRTGLLRKKIAKFDLVKKFNQTSFAQKQATRALRAGLNDFQRFQVQNLKRQVGKAVARQVKTLRKAAAKKTGKK